MEVAVEAEVVLVARKRKGGNLHEQLIIRGCQEVALSIWQKK